MGELFPLRDRTAIISDDGLYRYDLTRTWNPMLPPVCWVMLNPSEANADIDDPTIRRCIAFAKREKAGGITVRNLFAFRSPDPKALLTATDPVGPSGDYWIADILNWNWRAIVCGWGACKLPDRPRGRADQVLKMLSGMSLHCLGKTASKAPRHPLYVSGDQPLEVM